MGRRGKGVELFLSTPSARRATQYRHGAVRLCSDFYPRPPRGGRRKTYALLLEGLRFLSTPSARRATRQPQPVLLW